MLRLQVKLRYNDVRSVKGKNQDLMRMVSGRCHCLTFINSNILKCMGYSNSRKKAKKAWRKVVTF